ncbi:MAG: TetR/AcrR family transcriptional regulator [Oscillospiraceae bacterium]|nr:TetR/AcrR family transcriptional regulator [Oscillospiraceae bacterium]
MSHKKKAILEAFVQLLDEKPAKRITVNDIAARCGIGRNTFYYYFANIPALYEALEEQWVEMIRDCAAPQSIMDCVAPLVEYATEHKSGFLYVYRSVDRDRFQADLDRLWMNIVTRYADQAAKKTMTGDERKLLIRALKCAFVGMTIDWLDHDMDYDLLDSVHRVCRLVRTGSGQRV